MKEDEIETKICPIMSSGHEEGYANCIKNCALLQYSPYFEGEKNYYCGLIGD